MLRCWMMTVAAGFALLASALAGCTTTAVSDEGDDFAILVVQMNETDRHIRPAEQEQRSWVSTWLLPSDPAEQQPWVPSEVHVRLRGSNAVDPDVAYDHVLRVDGSQFTFQHDREATDTDDAITVRIDRPGASFVFTGGDVGEQNKRTVYGGMVRIRFQRSFRDAADRLEGLITTLGLMRAALLGLDHGQLSRYGALDVNPTLEQVVALTAHDLSATDIQQLEEVGYRFSTAELLDLRASGVSINNAVAFRRSGFSFDAADLKQLHAAGLMPSYAVAMKNAGFARDAEQLVELHKNDVRPGFAARIRHLMLDVSESELIQLAVAGVDPESVATFQEAGYHTTPAEAVLLHQRDVSADDALTLREAGYDFTVNELVILRWREVPVSFAVSLLKDGFEPLSAEQIARLYKSDVTPETVRLLRQQHQAGLPEAEADAEADPPLNELIDELADTLSTQ